MKIAHVEITIQAELILSHGKCWICFMVSARRNYMKLSRMGLKVSDDYSFILRYYNTPLFLQYGKAFPAY
jgi:hypothetical protein